MKDPATIAAFAAALLALIALIGLAAPIYSRLGQLEAEIKHSRELADARHRETLEEIRRLTEALVSHYHSPEGGVIFTVPPRVAAPAGDAEPGAAGSPAPAPGGFPLSRE